MLHIWKGLVGKYSLIVKKKRGPPTGFATDLSNKSSPVGMSSRVKNT